MDSSIPEDYLCPITQELMRDPVVAADGQSYEREAIIQWLQRGHKTSPLTGESLKHNVVIENHRLKAIIAAFRQSLPEIQRKKQIRSDLNVAIRLREEMIAQNAQTPNQEIGEYTEALKKKNEENTALKKALLKAKTQLQEMEAKMQAPISRNQERLDDWRNKEASKYVPMSLEEQADQIDLSEYAYDPARELMEVQAKMRASISRNQGSIGDWRKKEVSGYDYVPTQKPISVLKKQGDYLDYSEMAFDPAREFQKMETKMQAPISRYQERLDDWRNKEASKYVPMSLEEQADQIDLSEYAYDPARELMEVQAKMRSFPKCLTCSICQLAIDENLVFSNKHCRHRYCLYCVQESGTPISTCYLNRCPARLNLIDLKRFLAYAESERKNNQC